VSRKGFSLIELMIVFTILGIMAAFAYPSYRDSITRARRYDGQTALLDLANRMEHYYFEQHTYEGATLGTGNASDVLSSNHSAQNWYILMISAQTALNFTLEAIPQGSQAIEDKNCQTLTYNSLGVKGTTEGPYGAPHSPSSQCW